MYTTHFVGWTRPPHPFEVIPSFTSSDSESDQVLAVLLDFVHDDDIRAAITQPMAWMLGGAYAKEDITRIDPMSLYIAYTDPATWISMNQAAGWALSDVQSAFQNNTNLQQAVQSAINKRLSIGVLPQNEYDTDTVTVYYYDNDRLKRVIYPRTSLTTADGMALDPSNMTWWKNNNINTEQLNSDGSWSGEGFDAAKDLDAAWSVIASVIMAAISAVLIATGVGAAAGATILAFSAALLAEAQAVADALNGQSTASALAAFIDAITKFVGLTLPSGAISQATLAGLKFLNSEMKSLLPLVQATDTMSFADAATYIRANLPPLNVGSNPITEEQALSLAALLGSGAGPVYAAGFQAANYGSDTVIDGILGVLPDPDQQTLFRLGATIGLLKNQQVMSQLQQLFQEGLNSDVALQSSPIAQIVHQQAAMTDLLNYCRTVLEPRYGISQ